MNLYRVEVVADPVMSPSEAVGAETRKLYILAHSTEQAMLLGRSKYPSCHRIRMVELLAEAGQIMCVSSSNMNWVSTELN